MTTKLLPGRRYRITETEDIQGLPSPFTGLECTLVHYYGLSKSGTDSTVRLDATIDDLVERFRGYDGQDFYSAREIEDIFDPPLSRGESDTDAVRYGPGFYIDLDSDTGLAPID
tara:strand:- start:307 stop:648 length:342 start_codon:yes stop_codon:yes gene_type:complete